MKPFPSLAVSLLSVGFALSASPGRADDPANPPAPPPPANGDQTPPAPTPAPHHKRMRGEGYVLEDLTAKLTLTADQQKSVGGIIENGHSQAKALRGDDSLSKEDRRAKMKEIMTTTHDQIRTALTPDQQKIFDTLPVPGVRAKNTDNN